MLSSEQYSLKTNYYIIGSFQGTGNGKADGLNNRVGGDCNTTRWSPDITYKMILKVRVCSNDEVKIYKNCTVCKTAACYNEGEFNIKCIWLLVLLPEFARGVVLSSLYLTLSNCSIFTDSS